jgi:hypothetical protein
VGPISEIGFSIFELYGWSRSGGAAGKQHRWRAGNAADIEADVTEEESCFLSTVDCVEGP